MVYLFIFLGLLIAVIGLSIANYIVKRVKQKKEELNEEE